MKRLIPILFVVLSGTLFSQEKPDSLCLLKRQLYVGTENIEGKKIICGFYLTALEDGDYELDLSIMDDWVHKDSIKTTVTYESSLLCEKSRYEPDQKIERTTCHTFVSKEGLLLTLAFPRRIDLKGCNVPSFATISLPPDRKYYVNRLANMYYK